MNATNVMGNWNERKNRLKQKFAILMENDRLFEIENKEEISGRLQTKLGKIKEEFYKIISALSAQV